MTKEEPSTPEREKPEALVILSYRPQKGYYARILTPEGSKEYSSMKQRKALNFVRDTLPPKINFIELSQEEIELNHNNKRFERYRTKVIDFLMEKGLDRLVIEPKKK